MNEVILSEEQIARIVMAVKNHGCRFDESEARSLHRFAQSIENGGWKKWMTILDFGETLINIKKASTLGIVGLIIASIAGAIWAGFKVKIFGGGGQ